MSERIKELAKQASETSSWKEFGDDGYSHIQKSKQEVNLEKFAELIVAECVSVIQEELDSGQYSQPVHTGFRVSKNLIKQHFGVEE